MKRDIIFAERYRVFNKLIVELKLFLHFAWRLVVLTELESLRGFINSYHMFEGLENGLYQGTIQRVYHKHSILILKDLLHEKHVFWSHIIFIISSNIFYVTSDLAKSVLMRLIMWDASCEKE